MSVWLLLALAVILAGGFLILSRLKLLWLAIVFWVTFAAGIGVLALTGHTMLARWHLGPITGFHFWLVLVTSPEVLVFLFFMITDPKTAPRSPRHRIVYAVSLGLLASLMIAPATTEFASKVALLSSLAIVCLAIPMLRRWPIRADRRLLFLATPVVLAAFAGMIVFSSTKASAGFRALPPGTLPPITIQGSQGVQTRLDLHTAQLIAHDLLSTVHATAADRLTLHLAPGRGQSPPVAVAQLAGQTYQLHQGVNGHWTLAVTAPTQVAAGGPESTALAGLRLTDLAPSLGLDFQQGAFHYGMSNDTKAMMGGGLCWLDYNNDGWQDLFVVNSYSSADAPQWAANGGLPRSALFENIDGTFKDVSTAAHADLPVQGDGCAAADLNGDGHTDLVVTTTSGVDVLWNTGHGTFTNERLPANGWYTGIAVADVNGDGRPDLFVAGYSDLNQPVQNSLAGFPTNVAGVRDLLYLNEGAERFKEVGAQAGLETSNFSHGLGATFTDVNGDGRPDIYVANDEDPNQLYVNVPWPGGASADPAGLGFRFEERGGRRRRRRPVRRNGRGDERHVGRAPRSLRDQLAQRALRRVRPDRERRVCQCSATVRPGARDRVRRLGHDVGRLCELRHARPVADRGRDPGDESLRRCGSRARPGTGRRSNDVRRRQRRDRREGRAPERARCRGGGCRQRRTDGCRDQHDRRQARAPAPVGPRRPLARCAAVPVRAGSRRHRRAPERSALDADGAGGRQLSLIRGPAGPLRSRLDDLGPVGRRALPVGRPELPAQRRREPRRAHRIAAARQGRRHDGCEACRGELHARVPARPFGRADSGTTRPSRCSGWPACPSRSRPAISSTSRRRSRRPGTRPADSRAARPRSATPPTGCSCGASRTGRISTGTFPLLTERLARALPLARLHARGGRLGGGARQPHRCRGGRRRAERRLERSPPLRRPELHAGERAARGRERRLDGARPDVLAAAGALAEAAQGGGSVPSDIQTFENSQWGRVRTFASRVHPGPPNLGDPSSAAYKQAASPQSAPRHSRARGRRSTLRHSAGTESLRHCPPPEDAAARLAHDVRLDLALNAALNDAAVSAWGAKRTYQSPRPISMIRYLAFNNQLPLVPGLIERVHGRQLVLRNGRWVPGVRWSPLAPTPPSPGWASGDSAFAYAADEVLTAFTGRSFAGPAARAATQGVDRGTELPGDVKAGRSVGAQVGKLVWRKLAG